MPELPEVETIARGLRPALIGQSITAAHVLLPKTAQGEWASPATFELACTGRIIKEVSRRGKLLLIHFEEETMAPSHTPIPTGMAFHLKMTGRLFTYDASQIPHKHTRVRFVLKKARQDTGNQVKSNQISQLFFDDARTFGYVRLFSQESLNDWPFWTSLGPEPLDISEDDFCRRMQGRRAIKALLLDQHVLAGVGNIYADEALFAAGIHPQTKGQDVPHAKLVTLHAALQAVLLQSIEECGSSIRDYRDAHGNAGAFQNLFRVYGRSGQACMTCGTMLSTAKIAGRTTVFCQRCQCE